MSEISERFYYAKTLIDVQPDDSILEIGCGAGILVEQIAANLTSGKITAIDKSASSIKNATKRNVQFVAAKTVSFINSDFLSVDFSDRSFDKIIAFNVNAFLKDSKPALEKVHRWMNERSKLYIFYQFPYEVDMSATQPILQTMQENNFKIVDKKIAELKPTSVITVVATI